MSERAYGHGVPAPSTHPEEGSWPAEPTAAPAQRSQPIGQPGRPSPGPLRGLELPPLAQGPRSANTSASPSTTRIAGVASILNPIQDEGQPGQRRKLSQLTSPISSGNRLPPLAASVRNEQGSTGDVEASPRSARRILTPRSPSGMHRASSMGQLRSQAGAIDAQQFPFPSSPGRRSVQPGRAGAPPLPTPPARMQTPGYGLPLSVTQADNNRRASTGTSRARNASSSASPSTSYSSYSQAGQTSPIGPYASNAGVPMPSGHSQHHGERAGNEAATSEGQRQMGIPISSSGGQNVYQMMTLETTSGTVQLPVDVQAASRVADEKRKRNAGASARFRQRRKEKEKEASTSIARLEQQVKELADEAEFYRNDRNNLLTVLRGVPGMDHHLQRPRSPRRMRGSIGSLPPSMSSRRTSYMHPPESEPHSPETGRNVRRRTSTFSLPPTSQLPPPPPGPPMQQGYPQGGYGPIAPQPPMGALPPLSAQPQRQQQQQQHPGAPPHMQSGHYNPYGGRGPEHGQQEGR